MNFIVSTTGLDSNPGTEDSPFLSITKGMTDRLTGDTVHVRGGIYPEEFRCPPILGDASWANPVTLEAYAGETPILQPPHGSVFGMSFIGSGVHHVEVKGLVVDAQNCSNTGVKITWGSNGAAHHIRLANMEIKNARFGNGILTTGAVGQDVDYNEFIHLNVHDNGTDVHHGIYIATSHNLISGVYVHHNARYGVHVFNTDGGLEHNVVEYCRVYDNGLYGSGAGILLSSGKNHKARYNVVYRNPRGLQASHGLENGKFEKNTTFDNELGVEIRAEALHTHVVKNTIHDGMSDLGVDTLKVGNRYV